MLILYRAYFCPEKYIQEYENNLDKCFIFIGTSKNNINIKKKNDLVCCKIDILEILKDETTKEDLMMRETSYIDIVEKDRRLNKFDKRGVENIEKYRERYNKNKDKIREYYEKNKDKLKMRSKERYEKLKKEYNKFIFGENVIVEDTMSLNISERE
jgi:hypothetical protein